MIIPLEINNLSLLYLLFSFIIERAISFHSYFHFFIFPFFSLLYIKRKNGKIKRLFKIQQQEGKHQPR